MPDDPVGERALEAYVVANLFRFDPLVLQNLLPLRQELLMLNGKATHEASRVGPLEPVSALIADPKAKPDAAIEFAYREILTRRPTAEEIAEGREVIRTAGAPAEGLSDLRWALFNCHEFRYLP